MAVNVIRFIIRINYVIIVESNKCFWRCWVRSSWNLEIANSFRCRYLPCRYENHMSIRFYVSLIFTMTKKTTLVVHIQACKVLNYLNVLVMTRGNTTLAFGLFYAPHTRQNKKKSKVRNIESAEQYHRMNLVL